MPQRLGAFVQRKVFRIEQMLRPRATAAAAAAAAPASRTVAELNAVVTDSEHATHTILHELEKIDDAMRVLETASDEVRADTLRGMQRNVTAIYEACHFQDKIGQRIGNALTTINGSGQRNALLNGPKLEDDHGHVAQSDIDRMFTR